VKTLLLIAIAALCCAGTAAAELPTYTQGSAIGDGVPFKAYASVTPTVHMFGDQLKARVAVVADTKLVDPARLRVSTDFAPYVATSTKLLRLRVGRFAQLTWTWTLHCTTSKCIPRRPPDDVAQVFHFRPATIDYLTIKGTRAYGIKATFPPVEALSQISPGVIRFFQKTSRLNWRVGLTPVAKPTYRIGPGLLLGLIIALAALAALAAAGFGYRAAQAGKVRAAAGSPTTSSLDRALGVLRYAHEHGDETLQRKAFERVAGELGTERASELSRMARELAWSPRTPEDQEVESFAAQAAQEAQDDA
jgi:hypothetical protein